MLFGENRGVKLSVVDKIVRAKRVQFDTCHMLIVAMYGRRNSPKKLRKKFREKDIWAAN